MPKWNVEFDVYDVRWLLLMSTRREHEELGSKGRVVPEVMSDAEPVKWLDWEANSQSLEVTAVSRCKKT